MGVFASGVLAGPAKVALVVVAVGGLTAGAYFTYQIGPGGSAGADVPAGATEAASPTTTLETVTPTATAEPTIVPPTPSPSATAVPTLPPPATEVPSPTPDPACAARDHNHLNIEKLAAQPNMIGAVITEIDDDTIRIVFEGVEVIVEGSGNLLTFSGKLTREQQTRVVTAIDAVLYEC